MKRFSIILSLILLTVILLRLAAPAQAMEGRGGDIVVIGKDEVVEDDLYIGANQVRLEGTVKGDLVAAGSLIIVESTGIVEGDLIAAGQGVEIKGKVKDDVRAGGAVVKLSQGAQVDGDLVAAGFTIEIAQEAEVGEDMVAFASGVLLSGLVKGDAQVGAGGFQLDGQVQGNLNAEVGRPEDQAPFSPAMFMEPVPGMPASPTVPGGLTLGPQARVGGKLTYTADQDVAGASAAAAGGVTRNPIPVEQADGTPMPKPAETQADRAVQWVLELLRSMITLTLVGLLFAWLAPQLVRRGAEFIRAKPLPSLGWGLVVYAGFFFAFLVLLIAVVLLALVLGIITLGDLVGTTIGLGVFSGVGLTLALKITTSYISKILVGYLLGSLILGKLKPDWNEKVAWPLVLGVILVALLAAIPILGQLVTIVAILFGLGALWLLGQEWWQKRKTGLVEEPVAI